MKIKAAITIMLAMMVVGIGTNRQAIREMQQPPAVTTEVLDVQSVLSACVVVTDSYGHGSGVAIAPDLILTAGHCLGYPGSYVVGSDGKQYDIIDEWRSDKYDIGFLWIEGELPYLPFGNMPELLDEVYLVGAPNDMALQSTISAGVVSNLDVACYTWFDAIVVDASSWGGNSGGPLLNDDFQVIGICVGGPSGACSITVCESVAHIRQALEEYLDAVSE